MNSTPISGAQHAAPAPDPAPAPAARPRQVSPTITLDALETAARAFAKVSLGRRPAISTVGRTPSALTSAAGYAKASDYAFLKDPRLTLEQKLIRFYALFSKKLDDDIARLKDPSKASSGSSASKSSSTKKKGLFGKLVKTLGEKLLEPALAKIAGPVLAAGASALGFPMLAPILLKAAPALAGLASEAITSLGSGASSPSPASASGASSSSSSSGTSSASSTSGPADDRVQMLELQQAVDKQKEMFTLVSNMLRSLHDMRMSAIQNIR